MEWLIAAVCRHLSENCMHQLKAFYTGNIQVQLYNTIMVMVYIELSFNDITYLNRKLHKTKDVRA